MFLFAINILIAYLVGSVCSAVIICKMFDLPDPRTNGSQNPGATNVLRLAGKSYAIIVLLADMLKGLLPVLLAKVLGAGPITIAFTCLAAVIGHIYPIFFRFKGGKGVATAIGALLGFHFILGVMVIATWLIVAKFTRYSSLASLLSMIFAPFYSIFAVGSIDAFLPIFFIALIIIYQHRDNIVRLVDGKESKINFRHKETIVQMIDGKGSKINEDHKETSRASTIKPLPTKKTRATKSIKKTPTTSTAKKKPKTSEKKNP